jgi:hypothetical protein
MTLIAALILASSLSAEVADIAWLAGSWRGQMSGGKIEEVWTPSEGGVMMGMFRMVNAQGQASFYEFQIIENTPDGVRLRIKHFNRAMKGQEAPDKFADFKLSRSSPGEAFFESDENDATVTLLYKRLPNAQLQIDFHKVIKSTGKTQKIVFAFERAN